MEEVFLYRDVKDPNLFLSGILKGGFPIRTVDKSKAIQCSNEEEALECMLINEDVYGIEYSKLFEITKFVKEE